MNEDKTCATCLHWSNKQACLAMDDKTGLCLSPKMAFKVDDEPSVAFIRLYKPDGPNPNLRNKHYFTVMEDDVLSPDPIALVTSFDFGCKHHDES